MIILIILVIPIHLTKIKPGGKAPGTLDKPLSSAI